jgi:hypothetical protein
LKARTPRGCGPSNIFRPGSTTSGGGFTHQPRSIRSSESAAGLDEVAFPAAYRVHFQLLGVMPLSPEQKARLAELNAIVEAERKRRAPRRSPPPAGRGVLVE